MAAYPALGSMQQGAGPVVLTGALFAPISTSTYTQLKNSAATFCGLTVNTVGTTSTATFYDGISATVTMDIATDIIAWAAHPFAIGGAVRFRTTGGLPTGLTAGTTYYVSSVSYTADSFRVADTQAHAIAGTNTIALTGTQSGVHTGWDVTRKIGAWTTVAQSNLPLGPQGAQCPNGLFAVTADGGGAADLTVFYL